MPKITQVPVTTTASNSTYFVVTDNNITKRIPYNTLTKNQLAGKATFSSSTTTNVSFSNTEASANYLVFLENLPNNNLWVTNKTISGFVINSNFSNSETVGWLLIKNF